MLCRQRLSYTCARRQTQALGEPHWLRLVTCARTCGNPRRPSADARELVEATFATKGKLGISFAAASATGVHATPVIKAIKPDGLAADHSQLEAGLRLHEVNGEAVAGLAFEQALALVTNATRPTTMSFRRPPPRAAAPLLVTFSRPGSLGLKFAPIKEAQGLQLKRINPGTQAEEHPELTGRGDDAPALLLTEVLRDDGEGLHGESICSGIELMPYEDGIKVLKGAPRPVTLRFVSQPPSTGAQRLRAARSARLEPTATQPGPPVLHPTPDAVSTEVRQVERMASSATETVSASRSSSQEPQRRSGAEKGARSETKKQAKREARKKEGSREPARQRARLESTVAIPPTVQCEGMVWKSSSKDPNSSKGKWKQYYFVLTTGRGSTLSWFKSEETYNKQQSPVDKWLIVSCEAKFTHEAPISGEPIFTLSRLDMPSAIFMRCRKSEAEQWVAKLSQAAQLTPDLTKVLSNQSLRSLTEEEADTFFVGARVQVYSRTLGTWQTGEVTSHEPDGLIRVNYGDGLRTKKSVDPRDADAVRICSDGEEDTDEDGSQTGSSSGLSSKRSSLRLSFAESDYMAPFEIAFTKPGSLGLSFASDSEAGQPWVKAIKPDSQAARFPQLAVGLSLLSVNGEAVDSLVDAVSKIKASGRPATLEFRRDEALSESALEVAKFLHSVGCTDVEAVVAAFTSVEYADRRG